MIWKDLCLSDKDSISLEELARHLLGDDMFSSITSFFVELFDRADRMARAEKLFFVAFLTRRCHVLLSLFMQIFERREGGAPAWDKLRQECGNRSENNLTWERCEELCRKYFVTDCALRTYTDYFADCFAESGQLPELIVCDELLIHGRAMNRFLMDLEKRMIAHGRNNPDVACQESLRERVQHALSQALTLFVFTQNDDIFLLLPRYCVALEVAEPFMPKAQWRKLSMLLSRLIAAAPINNVAYSWSFMIPERKVPAAPREDSRSFHHYHTEIYGFGLDTALYLYPAAKNTRAVCTVRQKHTPRFDGKHHRLIVPYIAYGEVSAKNIRSLHDTLVGDVVRQLDQCYEQYKASKNNPRVVRGAVKALFDSVKTPDGSVCRSVEDYRHMAAVNDLLLGHVLMRRYQAETGDKTDLYDYYDEKLLARNFVWQDKGVLQADTVRQALKSIALWEPDEGALERYLDILTEGSEPLWWGERFWQGEVDPALKSIEEKSPIVESVFDTITRMGLSAEKNAYDRRRSGVFFTEQQLAKTDEFSTLITDVLHAIDDHPASGLRSADIYQIMAVMTHAMDLGLVSMSIIQPDQESEGQEEHVSVTIKCGEQALCVHPIRYAAWNPILAVICEKFRGQDANVQLEIQFLMNLFKDRISDWEPDLGDRLWQYVCELKESGQTPADWNEVSKERNIDVQMDAYLRFAQNVHDFYLMSTYKNA